MIRATVITKGLTDEQEQTLAGKLTVEYVTVFPPVPTEGVMYINTTTSETKAYKNGQYITIGRPVEGEFYTFQVPVPIMLGFNVDLDTPHHTRLYFPQAIAGIVWNAERTQIASETFTPQAVGGSVGSPLPNVAELQAWIDDFGSAGFYVEVNITPASGAQGELTACLTYHNTISIPK